MKKQGDCLHLKDTKYQHNKYNKHERAQPSHCRLLFCQHYFALQTIILPEWSDLRRSKTEWTTEKMKREEVPFCEKEREEDKRRNKQRTQMKTSAENTTERPPERPPNDPGPWFMSCQTQDPGPSLTITGSAQLPAPPRPFFIPNHQIKKMNLPPIQKEVCKRNDQGTFPPCKLNMLEQPQQIYNMANQEPNGNTWIWPTKASKTTQQIIAILIGTATIATTPLKSFAQWYGLKSKESLRLWPLTITCKIHCTHVILRLIGMCTVIP